MAGSTIFERYLLTKTDVTDADIENYALPIPVSYTCGKGLVYSPMAGSARSR